MLYRIEKINGILVKDLDDSDFRLELLLSYKILIYNRTLTTPEKDPDSVNFLQNSTVLD